MSILWQAAAVVAQATPSPSPTPGLREGLDESAISPGLAGFLAVFGIALVTVLLFRSLTTKLRGVRQRDGVAGVAESAFPTRSADDGASTTSADDGASRVPSDDGASYVADEVDAAEPAADGDAPSEHEPGAEGSEPDRQ